MIIVVFTFGNILWSLLLASAICLLLCWLEEKMSAICCTDIGKWNLPHYVNAKTKYIKA